MCCDNLDSVTANRLEAWLLVVFCLSYFSNKVHIYFSLMCEGVLLELLKIVRRFDAKKHDA